MADQDPPQEENRNGGRPRRQRDREDQTPVEELFDLSQPIPRVRASLVCVCVCSALFDPMTLSLTLYSFLLFLQVERPNKDAHEKELAELTAKVDAVKEERAALQAKIDAAMDSDRISEIGQKREQASQLRNKKQQLIDEKKAIRAKLDAMRNQQDKLAKDRKDARANIRFSNVDDIDKELKRLQRLQETTSMSLGEEKKLIKEMDALQASKKLVADLQVKESSIEDTKEARKLISAEIAAKDKEIDAVQKEIDALSEEIRKMSDKETGKRDKMKALFAEREALRLKVNDILKEKDAARDALSRAKQCLVQLPACDPSAEEDYSMRRNGRSARRKRKSGSKRRRRKNSRRFLTKRKWLFAITWQITLLGRTLQRARP